MAREQLAGDRVHLVSVRHRLGNHVGAGYPHLRIHHLPPGDERQRQRDGLTGLRASRYWQQQAFPLHQVLHGGDHQGALSKGGDLDTSLPLRSWECAWLHEVHETDARDRARVHVQHWGHFWPSRDEHRAALRLEPGGPCWFHGEGGDEKEPEQGCPWARGHGASGERLAP